MSVTEIASARRSRRFATKSQPAAALSLTWAAATHVGQKRAGNEDSYVAVPGLLAVADGLGGHSAGDVASAAAVSRLAQTAKGRSRSGGFLTPEDLREAFQKASEDITLATSDAAWGSGTTVTGIALAEYEGVPGLLVFNIGDSRVYRLREGVLQQVTLDHSYVQELVTAGQLAPELMEFHPDANVITRALGFGEAPPFDLWQLHPQAGDRFLVCSDGLTRELSHETLTALLGAGAKPLDTARTLVDAANLAGGRDNITVGILDVTEAPAAPAGTGS